MKSDVTENAAGFSVPVLLEQSDHSRKFLLGSTTSSFKTEDVAEFLTDYGLLGQYDTIKLSPSNEKSKMMHDPSFVIPSCRRLRPHTVPDTGLMEFKNLVVVEITHRNELPLSVPIFNIGEGSNN